MQACPQTCKLSVVFVRAGQLHLLSYYAKAESLLKIHERWLDSNSATEELGLSSDLDGSDIMFHVVKRLFRDVVHQISVDEFLSDNDDRTGAWHQQRELSVSEQRLLCYMRLMKIMDTLHFSTTGAQPELDVRWPSRDPSIADLELDLQFHHASQCAHLKHKLLARDGTSLIIIVFWNILRANTNPLSRFQFLHKGCLASPSATKIRGYRLAETTPVPNFLAGATDLPITTHTLPG